MKIRIQFLKSDQVVKTFDREVVNTDAAKALVAEIAKDSGIEHDEEQILLEHKFKAKLLDADGKQVELIESKAFDEAGAVAMAQAWAKAAGATFTRIQVKFLEA